MAIPQPRARITALYKNDADQAKSDTDGEKPSVPGFSPYSVDTNWRLTFENAAVLSQLT